jgi:hypothetical protein
MSILSCFRDCRSDDDALRRDEIRNMNIALEDISPEVRRHRSYVGRVALSLRRIAEGEPNCTVRGAWFSG